jgi:hypothetical protein
LNELKVPELYYRLGCEAVQSGSSSLTHQKYTPPQTSGLKSKLSNYSANRSYASYLLLAGYLPGSFFNPEDAGTRFLCNVSGSLPNY